MPDVAASYERMKDAAGAVWLRRDVLIVGGEEAVTFLQGQLSQDVTKVEVGGTAWSFVLQPHGKVDALVRLHRLEADRFIVDVDRGYGDAVVARLERFKLRTKVEIELRDWKVLGLRGPGLPELASAPAAHVLTGQGSVVVDASWPGLPGVDVIGAEPSVPQGMQVEAYEAYEALRIEAGVPEMGCEIDEKTIPAEVGINDRAVNFSKGCYTGQELVARIDARGGNVPRNLRGLVIDGVAVPDIGAKILPVGGTMGKPFGVVSSASFSPSLDAPVALAMIRRDVPLPTEATIVTDEGTVRCRIQAFPLS